MKKIDVLAIITICVIACYIEFFTIKTDNIYSWIEWIPFFILIYLSITFAFIKYFRLKQKSVGNYFSVLLGITTITIIFLHDYRFKCLRSSESNLRAHTYEIGSDGGLILNFKKNGILLVEKQDHWCVSYYLGNYTQVDNQISIDVDLDFDLAKRGIIKGDSLLILDDKTKFEMMKFY